MVRWNLKELFYHDDQITEEKVNAYYDRMRSDNALDAQIAVAHSLKVSLLKEYIGRIPEMKTETLIIWGENDKWIPLEIGYRFRSDLLNSTLSVIPQCGHMPQEEYPEMTAQMMLDFIEGGQIDDTPRPE